MTFPEGGIFWIYRKVIANRPFWKSQKVPARDKYLWKNEYFFFKKEHHSLLHFRKNQFKLSNPHLEIRTDWIQEITKVLNAFMFLQKCPLFAGKWNQKELSFYISHVLDTKYSHSLKYSKVK